MSAPAMKALSPAPVKTTPRTAASSRASSNAARKSSQVRWLSALSTLGRLSVTYAMPAVFSYESVSNVGAAIGAFMTSSPSHERAEPGDGFADDHVLHLIRALVR